MDRCGDSGCRANSVFLIIIIFSLLISPVLAETNSTPGWATDQLELRDLLKQFIRETQEWQHNDGVIFYDIGQYKWDDEVELFYNWTIYYLLTGDESVYESIKGAALTYLNRTEYLFDHGYFKEPYFDTEHTLEGLIILANLAFLKPEDNEIISPLEDLVEHLGNWVPGYAEWFDTSTRHLKSIRPGTQELDTGCDAGIDWVFNLGFAKLALATFHATQNERYLNWVGDYLDGWIGSMERNERENGYYVIPSEVDPNTGEIGKCSGVWYHSAFEPGWGWHEKGNNANRDMRGAFLDYFRIAGEEKYLNSIKKQMLTLFQNGSGNEPAHFYNGQEWIPDTDKITAYISIQTDFFDPDPDVEFDQYMLNWYNQIPYHYPQMHYWYYRKNGDITKINGIHSHAIGKAENALAEIQAVTELPNEPDEFPKIEGHWGISLMPFGGITASRGEMPWTEVLYFRDDNTLGLYEGVAALVDHGSDSLKVFWLSNTTSADKYVKVQADFIPTFINHVIVDDKPVTDFDPTMARIQVPAGQTVQVKLQVGIRDSIPPNAPINLHQLASTETAIQIAWDAPPPAPDGDTASSYRVLRDGIETTVQDSTDYLDNGLSEQTTYSYEVFAIDKGGNESDSPVTAQLSTAADLTPPEIVSVLVVNEVTIHVAFNEPLEINSATNISNYSISPTLAIQQADLSPDKKVVYLTSTPHTDGVEYRLTVNNIADNSQSQNKITGESITYHYYNALIIENISRPNYYLENVIVGDPIYSDREYRVVSIPDTLAGLQWIITANDDKTITNDDFLSFSVNKKVIVYVAYDVRFVSVPTWMQSWIKTNFVIETDDSDFICFKQDFLPGTIELGANHGQNSTSMYLVLVESWTDKTPPEAPVGLEVQLIGGD